MAPLWRRQGGGRVVNVGSRVWVAGGRPAYVTSEAELGQLAPVVGSPA
jgi:3-oxoacyl-[acyl-carrier protein] reductase